MFIWFAALSFAGVWLVFRSPAADYRFVMLGAVLPLVELAFGRPAVLHTLAGAVGVLAIVMAATQRRRLLRRQWLGIPIGLMSHLALDGVWADKELFWWPFFGAGFADRPLPEVERGVLSLAMEVVGIVVAVAMVRRFRLTEPARRDLFLRTGRLGRDLVGDEG